MHFVAGTPILEPVTESTASPHPSATLVTLYANDISTVSIWTWTARYRSPCDRYPTAPRYRLPHDRRRWWER